MPNRYKIIKINHKIGILFFTQPMTYFSSGLPLQIIKTFQSTKRLNNKVRIPLMGFGVAEIAEDLKMVEYDLISGKGYLSKDFFKVPTNKSN